MQRMQRECNTEKSTLMPNCHIYLFQVVIVGNIETADQFQESRLRQLYRQLKKHKEAKHEGQVEENDADEKDDSTISVEPTKKIFIVSSVDNRTIIETIETEEDKKEYIKRSRVKRKRLRSKPSSKNGKNNLHVFSLLYFLLYRTYRRKNYNSG